MVDISAEQQSREEFDFERESQYWAFQKLREPHVPKVKGDVRTPVDAFVLEKLEEKGLAFSPEADRLTLLRRVYLDLVGRRQYQMK